MKEGRASRSSGSINPIGILDRDEAGVLAPDRIQLPSFGSGEGEIASTIASKFQGSERPRFRVAKVDGAGF